MPGTQRKAKDCAFYGEPPSTEHYEARRDEARAAIAESAASDVLEQIENCWVTDLSVAQFDELLAAIKRLHVPREKVRAAFSCAQKAYQEVFPGQDFPLRLPEEFN